MGGHVKRRLCDVDSERGRFIVVRSCGDRAAKHVVLCLQFRWIEQFTGTNRSINGSDNSQRTVGAKDQIVLWTMRITYRTRAMQGKQPYGALREQINSV